MRPHSSCQQGRAGSTAVGIVDSRVNVARAPLLMAPTTATERDARHLQRAIELAGTARGHTSPNPLVGAVIVKGGEVIGEGYHERAGGRTPSATRCPRAAAIRPARPSMCRSSPAATRAARRPAPTPSSRPASPGSSSPPTTRPRRRPAAASGILRDEGIEVELVDGEVGARPRACSTSPSASTPGPVARTSSSSRR